MGEVAARTDARRRQPLNLFRRGLITFYVQRQDRFGIIELNISNDLSLGKITIFFNSSSGSIGPTALDDSQFAYQHIANKFDLTRQYIAKIAKGLCSLCAVEWCKAHRLCLPFFGISKRRLPDLEERYTGSPDYLNA
jgi:hypothetical protein